MYFNKPPLPPKKETRCSSVDRILDSPVKQKLAHIGQQTPDTEGCSLTRSPSGRKARSVDDLLDENVPDPILIENDKNNNKEPETRPSPPERSKSSSPQEKNCETETITIQNTPRNDNNTTIDEETNCDTNSNHTTSESVSRKSREGSVLSNASSVSSTSTSDKRNNKKFFDKYVSKVKNYLKK